MKLISNKGAVAKGSLSLRAIEAFMFLTLLSLGEALLPQLAQYIPVNPVWLLAGASLCGSLAWGLRFVLQSKLSNPAQTPTETDDG